MLRQIDIQNLKPGMVIVQITEQNGPVKIKKSGLVTSQDMVQGLIEMGIQQVEIDSDQTVEVEVEAEVKIKAPKIKKSATQRMLESTKVTHTRIEDGLSDQFHRSLFLPSVQGIPSAWQFYTKRYSLAAFIALGGLGFGWTLANFQQILVLFSSPPEALVVSQAAPVVTPVASATKQPEINNQSSVQETNPKDVQPEAVLDEPSQQIAVPDNSKTQTEANDEVQSNTPLTEPEPQISADVLARFRKAITEVEDSPVVSPPVQNISSSEDVPRIDQLPAWVMTRLPSMAFSAHMYASVESERWVRVNGSRMVEGDKIDGLIEIVRIEPQHVILHYSGQTFSMAALTDW
ncbi:general secretion pathway protein GspB [uncultured Paraglaciecola sp.]|uniref:general secretion pathway protein GspB n=1 Tax=uncultured Paraglaciecola sp. TaxID=1765024 RepID=UPI0025EBCE22|nr:general secretion pathway protein GspB [uncultured Paraglaciecola sp.]